MFINDSKISLMKQILKFIVCTLLVVMIICSSCKKETAAPQPPVQTIDTFTTSGKEYVFSDWTWDDGYDEIFDSRYNEIRISARQLFFNPQRNIEVYILLSNSTTWTKLPAKIGASDLNYYVFDYALYVRNRYKIPADNLYWSKASIKVKFL